jgi:hypothetical protein
MSWHDEQHEWDVGYRRVWLNDWILGRMEDPLPPETEWAEPTSVRLDLIADAAPIKAEHLIGGPVPSITTMQETRP